MARKRMINPDFWTDPKIVNLNRNERLFFIGLISNSNDQGKLRGEPWGLKAKVFPADTDILKEEVSQWLASLEKAHLIQRYSVNNEQYIKLRGWDKNQKVLHSATYPYTKFPVAAAWVEFDVPNVEVNDRFYAHIYTDSPWPGLHIGADDSITNEHSNTTIRTTEGVTRILELWPYRRDWGWFGDKSKVNWMIRVVGTIMVPQE